MKINRRTSYPYPIWGWRDDYNTTIKNDDIIIEEISNKENFVFELELKAVNIDIDHLIENDKAVYACVVDCPSTFFHKCIKSKKRKFTVEIPRKEVYGKVEAKWMILSEEDIEVFVSASLNEDYQGHASFPLGAMIGYIASFELNTTLSDELRSLDDILVVVKNTDDDEIKYSFDERKIKIMLPLEQLEVFNNYGDKYPSVMHSTIVYDALIQAISKLYDSDKENLDWVDILKIYIENIGSEDFVDDDIAEKGYNLEQCIEITDYILQDPTKRMFSDIKEAEKELALNSK